MNEKMKRTLNETLDQGETVLWESGVQPFRLFDGREGKQTLLRWLICVVLVGGLIAAYAVRNGEGIMTYLVLLAVPAVVICSSVLSYRQTLGQRYFITDRRAMTIRPDGGVFSMNRETAGEIRIYKLDCGGVALALGSMLLAEGDRQLRWRANHPLESSTYVINGLVFYRPERAEEAVRLLRRGSGEV